MYIRFILYYLRSLLYLVAATAVPNEKRLKTVALVPFNLRILLIGRTRVCNQA